MAPQPNAQIEIAGYTTIESGLDNGDLEVIGVSLDNPGPSGQPLFTMQVLLILGGMMAQLQWWCCTRRGNRNN